MTKDDYLKSLRMLSDLKVKIKEVWEYAYYAGANVALLEALDSLIADTDILCGLLDENERKCNA